MWRKYENTPKIQQNKNNRNNLNSKENSLSNIHERMMTTTTTINIRMKVVAVVIVMMVMTTMLIISIEMRFMTLTSEGCHKNKLAICLECRAGAHRLQVIQSRCRKRVAHFDIPAWNSSPTSVIGGEIKPHVACQACWESRSRVWRARSTVSILA